MSPGRQLILPLPHASSFARDDFIGAPSNAAALALVESWPEWPAPLMLLSGPAGAGKSHLAAIFAARTGAALLNGAEIGSADPDATTCAPALALDDAEAGLDAEAAFFHLLNFARTRGVAMLLTAKGPPALWGVKTPDLLSRLRLAPVVEILAPEPPLIEAALTKMFADRQLAVEPTLIAYIARRLDRSLGSARALVEALDAEALAQGRKVTRAMAAALLSQGEPE
jgi:chromosomal replication initiation ATPase DnaA